MESSESSGPPFEAVLGALPAGIALIDGATQTIRWANPAFLDLLDERARGAGAAGLPLDAIAPGTANVADRIRHAIVTGEAAPAFHVAGRSDGAPRVWRLTAFSLPAAGGGGDALVVAVDVTADVDARRRAEALATVAADLGRAQRLEHVLSTSLARTRELFGPAAALWTLDGGRLEAVGQRGRPAGPAPVAAAAPAVADALASGRTALLLRSAASPAERDWLERASAGAALLVPLVADGRPLGLLVVLRERESAPPPEDVAWAGAVAAEIALAMAKLKALELERRNAERVALLQAATAQFSAARATEDVARALFDHAATAIGADSASLVFVNAAGRLETVASRGHSPEEREYFASFAPTEPYPAADAFRRQEPIWLADGDEMDRAYPALAPLRPAAGLEAWASLPLVVRGEALGAVGIAWRRPHPFPPDERSYVLAVVEQCAQAIERARLLDAERNARARAEVAESEARHTNELQERVMAIVGHDLRTPLSSITLATRLLYHQGLCADASATVGRIANSAARMAAIVRDLVDFGRARSGQGLSLFRRAADVAAICERSVRELADLNPDRDLALERSGDTALPVDPDRIAQLVSNLVGNALHHAGPNARVRVRVDGDADEVRLSVADDGRGIPAERLDSLFEPFQRRGRGGAGLGLGLFIVREIARAHGGDVMVRSEPGAGTTFTVRLPRSAVPLDIGGRLP